MGENTVLARIQNWLIVPFAEKDAPLPLSPKHAFEDSKEDVGFSVEFREELG